MQKYVTELKLLRQFTIEGAHQRRFGLCSSILFPWMWIEARLFVCHLFTQQPTIH